MFSKKQKKSPEELQSEREERIAATANSLRAQLITMESQKKTLLNKVVEARKLGLKPQEEQARGILRRCMAISKQAQGMLMTLELAVQSRDLATLNRQFMECIGVLSDDITQSSAKTDVKKTKEKYIKAMYNSDKQSKQIDEMLEIGDYAAAVNIGGEQYGEFDSEIDNMVSMLEGGESQRTGNKIRN